MSNDRATRIADKLNIDFALIHKERRNHDPSHPGLMHDDMALVGDVSQKVCIIVDDLADTCTTLCKASKFLVEHGATRIVAIITHGIFSGNALDKINCSAIDEVIVSNTVPQEQNRKKCKKIKIMDIAPLFAEAIRRSHNGESVSFLFDVVPY